MSRPAILYIEDEEADALLFEIALKKAHVPNLLLTVKDGEEALAYFQGSGQYADRNLYPIPGLVLLDLNIPRLSGRQVLQWIREQPQFASLPVIVFTSAALADDIEITRQLGANDFILKPSGMQKMLAAVENLKQRWLQNL